MTTQDIRIARQVFEANEPRDLFYRAATELVELALHGTTSLSVAEALAVLLQTRNRKFYRCRHFDSQHYSNIEQLITNNQQALANFRQRSIKSFREEDEATVGIVFQNFAQVLGPVGAAKCLHLLAPLFFPLWDRAIAEAYGLSLKKMGKNADLYCCLIAIVREQAKNLGGQTAIGRNPLQAIDEYNCCKYSKQWIQRARTRPNNGLQPTPNTRAFWEWFCAWSSFSHNLERYWCQRLVAALPASLARQGVDQPSDVEVRRDVPGRPRGGLPGLEESERRDPPWGTED